MRIRHILTTLYWQFVPKNGENNMSGSEIIAYGGIIAAMISFAGPLFMASGLALQASGFIMLSANLFCVIKKIIERKKEKEKKRNNEKREREK